MIPDQNHQVPKCQRCHVILASCINFCISPGREHILSQLIGWLMVHIHGRITQFLGISHQGPHHLKTEASAKEITGGLMAAAVRLGGHHVVDLLEVPQLVGLDDE